jgi:hypothetical protein
MKAGSSKGGHRKRISSDGDSRRYRICRRYLLRPDDTARALEKHAKKSIITIAAIISIPALVDFISLRILSLKRIIDTYLSSPLVVYLRHRKSNEDASEVYKRFNLPFR